MPVCIYCVTDKPASAFTKVEHVLPQAFGRFRDNLTLKDTVCDECNEFFGNNIDLYLARDTPDGFNRFVLGYRPPDEYKHLGEASTMTHRLTDGPWAGAFVEQSAEEGELGVRFRPQVGFGPSPTGPFKWFLVTDLPTKEQCRELFETGHRHLHFPSMPDEAAKDAVVKELVARGLKYEDAELPPDLTLEGKTPNQRIEAKAIIGPKFGRALAKIGLNYLAHEFGAATALMTQFNTVRECVRWDKLLPLGSWRSEGIFRQGAKPGHILILTWDPAAVVVRIAFHSWIIYRVVLAQGGFIIQQPAQARGALLQPEHEDRRTVPAMTIKQQLAAVLDEVRALRAEVADLRSALAAESEVSDEPEWLSSREVAAHLKICRSRKLPLLVRARLLTPKHGKFSRSDAKSLKQRGIPTMTELGNAVAAIERPPRQRRRRNATPATAVSLMDWRPPASAR